MDTPNKIPTLDVLEKQKGFVNTGTATYLLLDWPSPVSGPAFEQLSEDCVGAYVVEVKDLENIPTGSLRLAVWPNKRAYEQGLIPRMFDMRELKSQTPNA